MSTVKPRKPSWRKRLASEKELWFWTLLFIAWWAVFFLMPIYGISYAFFDYKPGRTLTMDDFVGFKHFAAFFQSRDAMNIIRNTLVLSGLRMTVGFITMPSARCAPSIATGTSAPSKTLVAPVTMQSGSSAPTSMVQI